MKIQLRFLGDSDESLYTPLPLEGSEGLRRENASTRAVVVTSPKVGFDVTHFHPLGGSKSPVNGTRK